MAKVTPLNGSRGSSVRRQSEARDSHEIPAAVTALVNARIDGRRSLFCLGVRYVCVMPRAASTWKGIELLWDTPLLVLAGNVV